MKTSILKTALVIVMFLLIASLTVTAFNGKGNKYNNNKQVISCSSQLPGLSESQINALTVLWNEHQKTMEEMRQKRRAAVDEKTKADIRIKMINTRDAHRAEVMKQLTPEQQTAYNLLQSNGYNQHFPQNGNRKGKGINKRSCRRN
jgi:hypothetical protein